MSIQTEECKCLMPPPWPHEHCVRCHEQSLKDDLLVETPLGIMHHACYSEVKRGKSPTPKHIHERGGHYFGVILCMHCDMGMPAHLWSAYENGLIDAALRPIA